MLWCDVTCVSNWVRDKLKDKIKYLIIVQIKKLKFAALARRKPLVCNVHYKGGTVYIRMDMVVAGNG